MFASGFSWFRLIPFIDHDGIVKALGIEHHLLVEGRAVAESQVFLHAWLAAAVLVGFAIAGRVALERAKARPGIEKYFSSERLGLLTIAEMFVGGIRSLMSDLLEPRDVRLFFPLIAGLFAYIFTCNVQSLLPGFLPPTDNINTNAGMALIAFLTFVAIGLQRDAVGFVKHLAGPTIFLAPLMFPIELISLIIRPISLTIRLTANLFGDHQVFTIMSGIVPLALPSALLLLGLLVSVVQAFVFSLLTVIYIHLSLPHDDHAHEGGHH